MGDEMAVLADGQIGMLAFQRDRPRIGFGKPGICVDTHVHRISHRFGWVNTKSPEETERALYKVTEKRWWANINLYLVTWGQQVCKPVYPLCGTCAVHDLCPRIGVTRQGRTV